MKVYVTQGHQNGIGLEVFFKSCLFLKNYLPKIQLIGFKDSFKRTLISLKLPFKISNHSISLSGLEIPTLFLDENVSFTQSFQALKKGMELTERGGVLFTLPTSKDQLKGHLGHTEFLRSHYYLPNIGMSFISPSFKLLLLSDHIPLKNVGNELTENLIFMRLQTLIKTFHLWKIPFNRILISGINPHAGENGLIGTEDQNIQKAILKIKKEFYVDISGPYPADTMFLKRNSDKDVLVYCHHDQGLGVFKGLEGFIGANVTLGAPYPRLSPDHGTSFELFGKNVADYRGCLFSLNLSCKILQQV